MMSLLLTNFPLVKIGHFLVQVDTEWEIFKTENKEPAFITVWTSGTAIQIQKLKYAIWKFKYVFNMYLEFCKACLEIPNSIFQNLNIEFGWRFQAFVHSVIDPVAFHKNSAIVENLLW